MSLNIRIGYATTVLLALAAVVLSSAATAMEIRTFDKMANDDQAQYVGELIQGAEKVLTDGGRSNLAAQVSHLFVTNVPGAKISIGMAEFMRNLAILRVADLKNAVAHPNDPRIEVEDAMAVTLQKNHIELPDSFFTVMKDFKPKHPLKSDAADSPAPPTAKPAAPTNAAAASAPAPQINMIPDDGPVGEGGFISPPAGYSPNK